MERADALAQASAVSVLPERIPGREQPSCDLKAGASKGLLVGADPFAV